MKEYAIMVSYEVGGYVLVDASSEEEAESIANKMVADEGEEAIHKVTHRDYSTFGVC